ncbi:MAG TPA: hypothetical protein PLS03_17960, partial [Terrimicrobiaceae bacterium]|nr:hypothetical protein [Terrimicrobiaceae bacterium]
QPEGVTDGGKAGLRDLKSGLGQGHCNESPSREKTRKAQRNVRIRQRKPFVFEIFVLLCDCRFS